MRILERLCVVDDEGSTGFVSEKDDMILKTGVSLCFKDKMVFLTFGARSSLLSSEICDVKIEFVHDEVDQLDLLPHPLCFPLSEIFIFFPTDISQDISHI